MYGVLLGAVLTQKTIVLPICDPERFGVRQTDDRTTPKSARWNIYRATLYYAGLITVLFSTQCSHFLEVRAMRHTLVRLMPQFEALPPESIAQILWSDHLDARMFFSAPHLQDGTLPQSQVRYAAITGEVCQRLAEHRQRQDNCWLPHRPPPGIAERPGSRAIRSNSRRYCGLDDCRSAGTPQPPSPSTPGDSRPSCMQQEGHHKDG